MYKRAYVCRSASTCTRGESAATQEAVNNFQSCVFPSYISARCVHTTPALRRCIRKRALCSRDRPSREIGLHPDAPVVEACERASTRARFGPKKMYMYVRARCIRSEGRRPTCLRRRKSSGLSFSIARIDPSSLSFPSTTAIRKYAENFR